MGGRGGGGGGGGGGGKWCGCGAPARVGGYISRRFPFNAAFGRCRAVRAYGDEAVALVVEQLAATVLLARDQPPDSKQFSALENTTQFGVAAQVGGCGHCAFSCHSVSEWTGARF